MQRYKVTFLPDNVEVDVDEGTTLLDAAEKAGIYINNLCGGQGLCGECRLQILSGRVKADRYAIGIFTKEELQNGYVLACQTTVTDNLDVMVPAQSRIEIGQIVTDGTPLAYSEPEKVYLHKRPFDPASFFEPLVSKVYLELPEPTLDDNMADIDRVIRELRKKTKFSSLQITLACLQGLAINLRQNSWKVTATIARFNGTGRILNIEGGDTTNRNYGLAVDVGTTTVVVQLIDMKTGNVAGVEGSHNLQAHYGEDVISRMVFACGRGSVDPVHQAVISNINNLTRALCKEKNIDPNDINAVVAAGNTTMSHFLLNMMPCSIRLEPYVPTATIYPQVSTGELGIEINPQGILEIIPSVASYVGGDIVADILACGLADKPEVKCLIDVGTNGEIAIGNNEWIVCCSASAGPAFEGGGARSGMRAARGAIEKIVIDNGQVKYKTIGKTKARGICGSGLIDAIYELVRNGIIGQEGKFHHSIDSNRLVTDSDDPYYILAFPEETDTGEAISISESEIANLIKSKGAVFAAIKSLADYVGLTFEQLDTIYVAGGFGSSLNIKKAIAIGLLPDINPKRIQFIGNGSVMGARMALLSAPAFEKTLDIAKRMTNIELSNYAPFMDEFVASLFLPHTNGNLFPSVTYIR